MTTNEQIADALENLADMLEFQGDNPFRLRALKNGARVVRDFPEEIADLVAREIDLTQFDGIGDGVAKKCVELVNTGRLKQLDDLFSKTPSTVLDLMKVPKLGPKKAAAVHQALGVSTLDDLQVACEQHRIRDLPGFGAKTEAAILEGLQLIKQSVGRLLWCEADQIAKSLRRHLLHCPAIHQLEVAGSYRRLKETVGDLDLLVDATDRDAAMDCFAAFDAIDSILARGPTKMAVRLRDGFQVDLRVVPRESFGAALVYFTGSKQHNIEIRSRAKKLGLKVNEWGVYRDDDETHSIAGGSEEDVYRSLQLPWIPPELREARHEFEWAEYGTLPRLIEVNDLRGDLHAHTNATDGSATLAEMAQAAAARGLHYLAITDHSQRVTMARGLNADRLLGQWRDIDELNRQSDSGLQILKGIECDILENGEMDLPDAVLAQADWVVASVHYGQNQPRAQITARILNALRNPHVDVIAHPTGRLINRRKPYDVDLEAVFQAAAEFHKCLELNASPHRLDLNDVHLAAAKAHGIVLVISTDAHRPDGLDDMRFGIHQARRAGLTPDDVGNCWPWTTLRAKVGRAK